MIKKLLSKTPAWFQNDLKRYYYRWQIKSGRFVSEEPEFTQLERYINKGDWVIDIGAGIGNYTLQFSKLVGKNGRVISFEPIPDTFQHLAANTQYCKHPNVTLINAAASESMSNVSMSIPTYKYGLKAYSRAKIIDKNEINNVEASVLTFSIDEIGFQNEISLIKIDAETHEPYILKGLRKTIERDLPTIIIETVTENIREHLLELNYRELKNRNSPNTIYAYSKESSS